MTDTFQTPDFDPDTLDIERDPNFVRATADKVFPIFLGRDFELIAVQLAPKIIGIGQLSDNGEELNFQPTYFELCRIRLNIREMTKVTINALESLISADVIKTDALIERMREWAKTAENSSEEDQHG